MRAGVIGVGVMGQNHVRVYSEVADLVGVVDKDISAAKKVAKRFNTSAFSTVDELIKEGVECVTIATPSVTHFDIAREVIRKNIHTLVEKPLAMTSAEGEELVNLAKKHEVILSVGHIERHNPVVRAAKESIQKEEFDTIISVSSKRVSSFPGRIKDVGVIRDMGIHDIDIAMYLIPSPLEWVYAAAGRTGITNFEDYANILMSFGNGVTASIEVNWLTPFKLRKLWLTCKKNFVEIDMMSQTVEVSSSKFLDLDITNMFHAPQEYMIRTISLKKQEPLKNEILDFISAIEKGNPPLVPGEDGVKALRVIEAIEQSIMEKRAIPVKW